ncbi:hypothetical protein [Ensifer sp. LCM 4579]|uniref:hypothetical protein n=1 Tax=Ensifer sp. LCM 4579 TaxID=1848292 RepID=UPI0008DAE5FD|nr:hypothetical protein [Ensifer sp. LCM 4579]OHV75356.1 hypothetical protein LCM4579_07450 [Ensifer sp. LCM 4579]
MPQKVTPEKLQKLTLMLGQTVAALRVNEILTCRLLRWAAAQSDDPQRFIEASLEATRSELQSAGRADGSTATAKAVDEALEYVDELAARIGPRMPRERPARESKSLTPLEGYHFPSFTSAPARDPNEAAGERRS